MTRQVNLSLSCSAAVPLQLREACADTSQALPGVGIVERLEVIDINKHHVCRRTSLSQAKLSVIIVLHVKSKKACGEWQMA